MLELMKRLALCLALVAALALALVLCGTALAGKESPRALAALEETACDTRESGGAPEIGVLENGSLTRFAP